MNSSNRLNGYQQRALSVAALVDPRTLAKYLKGGAVRPMTAERIRRALVDNGLERMLPQGESPTGGRNDHESND